MREASGTRPSACESTFACDSLDALSGANVESPAVWIPVGGISSSSEREGCIVELGVL